MGQSVQPLRTATTKQGVGSFPKLSSMANVSPNIRFNLSVLTVGTSASTRETESTAYTIESTRSSRQRHATAEGCRDASPHPWGTRQGVFWANQVL